jgi:diguanylate cyclase (GGDEF)-like protein
MPTQTPRKAAMRPLDVRLAARSAALLYGCGAVLLVAAAFLEDASARPGILALAGGSGLAAAALLVLARLRAASLWLVFGAELLAIGMIAALVAQTDGAQSLYPAYYLLPVLHAAVFQDRLRTAIVGAGSVAAFLAPLVYEPGDVSDFAAIAVAALLPAVAFTVVTQVVVGALRGERRALEEREAEALRIAESDELTGIGNYRRFWRALQSEAARARRHDQPFSLIVLDLDGFKAINDQLGHQAGDETLRRVARALEGQLREEDVLCRQGGDEFGVIAVAAGEAETRELARRLVDAVAAAGGYGLDEPLTASAGWATFGAPERSAEGLLALADHALRDAKRRRRPAPPPWPPAPRAAPARDVPQWPPAARPSWAPEPEPEPSPPQPAAGDDWRPRRRAEPAEPQRFAGASAGTGNGEPEAHGGPWGQPAPPIARAVEPRRPADPRLVALSDFSRALALADDEQAVVQLAVAHVAEALEAAAVELWRRDAGGRPHLVARGRHRESPGAGAVFVTPEELDHVMRTNHVAGNGDGRLLVPVSYEGRVDGVVAVLAGRPGGTALEERRLALAMAAQLGRALAAASLRSSLERADPAELARLAATAGADAASTRVVELALAAGRTLGLPPGEMETVRHAALLHNVGMLGVPAGLPLRPAPLSPDEILVVREHPLIAERLLRPLPHLNEVARTLRHLHERHDGAGYPDGLAGEEIPLASRILHAAVAYCAMCAPRPWRRALSDHQAREELRAAAGGQLDPDVVEALLRGLEAPAQVG